MGRPSSRSISLFRCSWTSSDSGAPSSRTAVIVVLTTATIALLTVTAISAAAASDAPRVKNAAAMAAARITANAMSWTITRIFSVSTSPPAV